MSPISLNIDKDGEVTRTDRQTKPKKDKCFNTFPCKYLTKTNDRCYCNLTHGAVYFLDECPRGYWYIPERLKTSRIRHTSWYEINKRLHREKINGKNHLAGYGNDRA